VLRKICLLFHGLVALLSVCQAGETPLTVFRASLDTNPGFKAAQASLAAEQEGVAMALGQLLPSISLSMNQSRNETTTQQHPIPARDFDYDGYNHSINLRQPIYRTYNWAQYRQAGEQAAMAESRMGETRDNLATRVLTAYFDVLYADRVTDLLVAQKAAAAGQIAWAEKAFKGGMGTRIDVDEAQAKLDIVEAQEIEARNQQEHARQTLRALVGRPLQDLAVLDPTRVAMSLPGATPLEGWLAAAYEQNAELASAKAQIRVAEQEIHKALSGHYPTLDLVASKGKSSNDSVSSLSSSGNSDSSQFSVGLQLAFPIFSGGQASAGVRQARARLEQARQLAEELMQNTEVKVRREYSNFVQGVAKVRAQEKAEASVAQAAIAYRKGMKAGVRSNLDVLQIDQQLYQTRRDLASARYTFILARVKLLALAGRLTEDEVAQISTWFVPATY
jgi:outer membrane protein, protease secretion system